MKFLHTADLHLGRYIYEKSLIDDQKHMLDTLLQILSDKSFDALVIAGDVYDRMAPGPDAVALFSSFLGTLKRERPDIAVLVIPGNHDSPARLGFGKTIFSALGLHFSTAIEDAAQPVLVKDTAFFLLPFVPAENLKAAAETLENARVAATENGAAHCVLAAHLFCMGGQSSDSERLFIGTAEKVDVNLFSRFDYAAFGHLHRYQKAGPNAWYAGSPLAYSFDETGKANAEPDKKYFLQVELPGGGTPQITPIEIEPLRKMRRLSGDFDYFYNKKDALLHEAETDYLEIQLTGDELVTQPANLLAPYYPNILTITQTAALRILNEAKRKNSLIMRGAEEAGAQNIESDFSAFLDDLYGGRDEKNDAALSEKEKLFQAIRKEIEDEEAAL
ncbi:MAG: exonuclease SbcCD subunit D [Spirochaetaceae bacterium]|nr:exonuclease SbcCD subunit D [Spirochaetaceae bacterium]